MGMLVGGDGQEEIKKCSFFDLDEIIFGCCRKENNVYVMFEVLEDDLAMVIWGMKHGRANVDVFPIHPVDINIKLICEHNMPDDHQRLNDRFHVKRSIRFLENWLRWNRRINRSKKNLWRTYVIWVWHSFVVLIEHAYNCSWFVDKLQSHIDKLPSRSSFPSIEFAKENSYFQCFHIKWLIIFIIDNNHIIISN